jgi:nucleoside-diphosphate-sugar epimerase
VIPSRRVFLTGGTGYLGSRLAAELVRRSHQVHALARPGSESRLPSGVTPVLGNALDHQSYATQVPPADTFVHLIGVPHPSPAKAAQFRSVDLASAREAVQAAANAKVSHFVYVSVAHPAPVMTAYWTARAEAEGLIRDAGLTATILRPWYVLGPGHRWPVLLRPLYWIAERIPATRDGARRLGLVAVQQMVATLVWVVEHPASGIRALSVADIRRGSAG